MPKPVRHSDYISGYTFDTRVGTTGRFRDAQTGRLVRWESVRSDIDRVIADSRDRMKGLSEQLVRREIDLPAWQTAMAREVKTVQGLNAIAAHGGWQNMTNRDWLAVARDTKTQYRYLERFAVQLETGKQPLNGRVAVRAQMYADAGRTTYEEERRKLEKAGGMAEERNVLGPTEDHCTGEGSCIEQSGKGWVPIGTLLPVGRRLCRTNCLCSLEYRGPQE